MVNIYLTFEETPKLSSIVAIPFSIPTNMYESSSAPFFFFTVLDIIVGFGVIVDGVLSLEFLIGVL